MTGGVLSSLGKGLSSASLGALLEARGLRVTFLKLDPYLNVDPGTMNPFQHGEVYVTDDGAETDLDLGHYERFSHARMSKRNNVTAGPDLRRRAREGAPRRLPRRHRPGDPARHRRDQGARSTAASEGVDVLIVEVGGTVGDIESLPFLEAIRQMRADVGRENTCYIHIALVPYIATAGELKTKPVQHSVKELRTVGIAPDIILCRTDRFLPQVGEEQDRAVLQRRRGRGDHREGRRDDLRAAADPAPRGPRREDHLGARHLDRPARPRALGGPGRAREEPDARGADRDGRQVRRPDRVLQEPERGALPRGFAHRARVEIEYFDSEKLDDASVLAGVDGILVPHGFGSRGAEGKIVAVRYAREQRVPYFGICYGMQLAVIEFARHVAGLERANSREIDPDDAAPGDRPAARAARRRRRRAPRCGSAPGRACSRRARARSSLRRAARSPSATATATSSTPSTASGSRAAGLVLSGTSPDGRLVEIVELADHPWFLGCQFHPEFQSTPFRPAPAVRGVRGGRARARGIALSR